MVSLQAMLWWIYRKTFPVHQFGGVELIDIRMNRNSPDDAKRFAEAMAYIGEVPAFLELVRAEINFVGFAHHPRESISLRLRAYITPMSGHEGKNSYYLATRLVWAAAYLRRLKGVRTTAERACAYALDEQLRFAAHFPDYSAWRRYLLKENSQE